MEYFYPKLQTNDRKTATMLPKIGNLLRKNKEGPTQSQENLGWIDSLPGNNPLEAMGIINQKLSGIVVIDMPPESWRLKALLQIDSRCRTFVRALETQYISVQKLRPELDDRMWDAVYAWYRTLARGYRTFVQDYVSQTQPPAFQREDLPLIVSRAMQHQARIARWRYMRYQGMPEGGWLALHKLFELAEAEGFALKPLKLYDDRSEISVCELYIEALMLDTLNHTNMTKLQIAMVNGWLRQWLKASTLSRAFDEKSFLFYVDLAEDRAARRIRNFTPTPTCRYWSTDRMVKIIDLTRRSLEQGKSPAELRLGSNAKPAECEQILAQLMNEWSRTNYQRQRRTENRNAVATTATVANGLANVWQQVKDVAESITRRAGGYMPTDDRSFEERLASHSIAVKPGGPVIAFSGAAGERWLINDESTSGFGALVGAEGAPWAKLGRLVALVTEDNRSQAATGVIRSIKVQAGGQRHIGIEVLHRHAVAIQITDQVGRAPARTGDIFIDATVTNPGIITLRGLWLPEDKSRQIPSSILLPNAEFNPASTYEISRGKQRRVLKLGKPLEQKDDWIRVQVLENDKNA